MIKARSLKNLIFASLVLTAIIYLAKVNQIDVEDGKKSATVMSKEDFMESTAENDERAIEDMEEEVDRCAKRHGGDEYQEVFDFEAFDNKKGATIFIVPNIVHTAYLNQTFVEFDHMITLFSIFLNHNPAKIMIHCDDCSFHGPYWKAILSTRCLKDKIVIHQVTLRDKIFGTEIEFNQHR